MKVYLVGRDYDAPMFRGGVDEGLLGVVETEDEAAAACEDAQHFYIIWELGDVGPHNLIGRLSECYDRRIYPKEGSPC
jgi:hypothetical protein